MASDGDPLMSWRPTGRGSVSFHGMVRPVVGARGSVVRPDDIRGARIVQEVARAQQDRLRAMAGNAAASGLDAWLDNFEPMSAMRRVELTPRISAVEPELSALGFDSDHLTPFELRVAELKRYLDARPGRPDSAEVGVGAIVEHEDGGVTFLLTPS